MKYFPVDFVNCYVDEQTANAVLQVFIYDSDSQ